MLNFRFAYINIVKLEKDLKFIQTKRKIDDWMEENDD
jgi:hypothetical protein